MKRGSGSRRAIAAYTAAAIVGFALGSYQYLMPAGVDGSADASASTSMVVSAPASQSPAIPDAPSEQDTAQESSAPSRLAEPMPQRNDETNRLVFASEGLLLNPALAGNRFIGFRVVRNDSDQRFSVGDVIVSVNGQPVENSAAGSELLIASLANPDAHVEIRAAKD